MVYRALQKNAGEWKRAFILAVNLCGLPQQARLPPKDCMGVLRASGETFSVVRAAARFCAPLYVCATFQVDHAACSPVGALFMHCKVRCTNGDLVDLHACLAPLFLFAWPTNG